MNIIIITPDLKEHTISVTDSYLLSNEPIMNENSTPTRYFRDSILFYEKELFEYDGNQLSNAKIKILD